MHGDTEWPPRIIRPDETAMRVASQRTRKKPLPGGLSLLILASGFLFSFLLVGWNAPPLNLQPLLWQFSGVGRFIALIAPSMLFLFGGYKGFVCRRSIAGLAGFVLNVLLFILTAVLFLADAAKELGASSP